MHIDVNATESAETLLRNRLYLILILLLALTFVTLFLQMCRSQGQKRRKYRIALLVGLPFSLLALLILLQPRTVQARYQRHPRVFQTVAEYFCASDREPGSFVIYKPNIGQNIAETQSSRWPQEVTEAVNAIFRRSDCGSIHFSSARSGAKYCVFKDESTPRALRETGVMYVDGQTSEPDAENGWFLEWEELAPQWFYFKYQSYSNFMLPSGH